MIIIIGKENDNSEKTGGQPMKWGILATGNIAGKFAQTVGKMEKEEQIVAVGSRSLERGKEFAEKYGIST